MASTNSSGQDHLMLAHSKLSEIGMAYLQRSMRSLPGVQVVCQDSDKIRPCKGASNYVYYMERSVDRNGYENSICRIDDRLVVMTHPGEFYYQTAHDNCILPALVLIGICLTIYLLLNRRRLWIDRITIYQFGVNILQGVLFLWTVGLNRFLNYPLGQLGCSVTSYLSTTAYLLTFFVSPLSSLNARHEPEDIDKFERLGGSCSQYIIVGTMLVGFIAVFDAQIVTHLGMSRCCDSTILVVYEAIYLLTAIVLLSKPFQQVYFIRKCCANQHNMNFPYLATRLKRKFIAELVTWLPIVAMRTATILGLFNTEVGGYIIMRQVTLDLYQLSCLISPLLVLYFPNHGDIVKALSDPSAYWIRPPVRQHPQSLFMRGKFKRAKPIDPNTQLPEGGSSSSSSVSMIIENILDFQKPRKLRRQAATAQRGMIPFKGLTLICRNGSQEALPEVSLSPRTSRLSLEESKTNRSRSKSI